MKQTKKTLLSNKIIERMQDNQLVGFMHELPDTDELLRKAGVDQEVYNEILQDSHVMGEVRQMYSALVGYKYEVSAGDDSRAAQAPLDVCQSIFNKRPHKTMRWNDLFWSIGKAPLTGRRVHLIQWAMSKDNKLLLPEKIVDLPERKYAFDHEGDVLLKTADNAMGELAEDGQCLVTRHMASATNPYGMAILSACFWPWMFKNGGLKFFVRFVERFGQPFPVGKYPQGTDENDVNKLVESLTQLVEDAVAAIPDTNEIELLESKTSGQLPQERLILLMNREMSKALTSQTAASELTDGSGSRAASQTHQGRTDQNAKADRALVEDTINQLFEYITVINFGEHVAAPKFKYVDKKQIGLDDVKITIETATAAPITKDDFYSRTGFTKPADGEETIFLGGSSQPKISNDDIDKAEFSKAPKNELNDIEQSISDLIDYIKQQVEEGETLDNALDMLVDLVPGLDKDIMVELYQNELVEEFGQGMLDAKNA